LRAPEVEFKIQNSKFKHVELMNVSAKNGRNFLEPYSSWFLACCQFSDSVELMDHS